MPDRGQRGARGRVAVPAMPDQPLQHRLLTRSDGFPPHRKTNENWVETNESKRADKAW